MMLFLFSLLVAVLCGPPYLVMPFAILGAVNGYHALDTTTPKWLQISNALIACVGLTMIIPVILFIKADMVPQWL